MKRSNNAPLLILLCSFVLIFDSGQTLIKRTSKSDQSIQSKTKISPAMKSLGENMFKALQSVLNENQEKKSQERELSLTKLQFKKRIRMKEMKGMMKRRIVKKKMNKKCKPILTKLFKNYTHISGL